MSDTLLGFNDWTSRTIAWRYESFVRQAHELSLQASEAYASRVTYLHVQQDMLEADIDCEFRSHPELPAPYLDLCIGQGSNAIRAKAVIINQTLDGCFRRLGDRTQERFRVHSTEQLIALLKAELQEPSLNFCTIFGDSLVTC